MRGGTPAVAPADDACDRGQAVPPGRRLGCHDQGSGAVVDAGRVAGRDRAPLAKRRRQLGELLEGRAGPRVLVALDHDRLALALRDAYGRDLLRQPAALDRGGGARLRAGGEGVLVRAADGKLLGDVLAGLGHRIDAVARLHHRVDEAPADRGVVHLAMTGEGSLGLGHHEGRTRHALDAARDHQFRLASLDGARRGDQRIHARAAKAVDRAARNALRQSCEQQRHAGDVAIVLARLVGAAEEHLVDGAPVDAAVPPHQRRERNRAEIVGAHARQSTRKAADRGPDVVADESLWHRGPSSRRRVRCSRDSRAASRACRRSAARRRGAA